MVVAASNNRSCGSHLAFVRRQFQFRQPSHHHDFGFWDNPQAHARADNQPFRQPDNHHGFGWLGKAERAAANRRTA